MISGIILAGGAGRRMKGRDKGLVLWHNKALVDHVIANLSPQVSQLIINANRHFDRYQQRGFSIVQDKTDQLLGPLAGIHAGLDVIHTEWLAVAPCDSPLFPDDYVQRLFDFAQKNTLTLTWVRQHGQDHPLFCLIHRALQAELYDFVYEQGGRRVLDFFNRHGRAMDVSDDLPYFANFNYEESLK